eukprot:COSAG01_NODE_13140_length_1629_cov_2.043137_3_plen_75_part_00
MAVAVWQCMAGSCRQATWTRGSEFTAPAWTQAWSWSSSQPPPQIDLQILALLSLCTQYWLLLLPCLSHCRSSDS